MRRLFSTIQILLVILGLFANVGTSTVSADFNPNNCSYYASGNVKNQYVLGTGISNNMALQFKDLDSSKKYRLRLGSQWYSNDFTSNVDYTLPEIGIFVSRLQNTPDFDPRNFQLNLELVEFQGLLSQNPTVCNLGSISFSSEAYKCAFSIWNEYENGQVCYGGTAPYCISNAETIKIKAQVTNAVDLNKGALLFYINDKNYGGSISIKNGEATVELPKSELNTGQSKIEARVSYDQGKAPDTCQGVLSINISASCKDSEGKVSCTLEDNPIIPEPGSKPVSNTPFQLCEQIPSGTTARINCETCAKKGGDDRSGVWTAVGCIQRDPKSIIQSLMQIGLGMGGGVALVSVLAGGFILSTSQGDPQKVNQAKEIITNSIIGLLFIIFSVVLLQFIGVSIFNIPGFGSVKQ